MPTQFFVLLERQQRLDAMLRLAQVRLNANPLEIARLRDRKRSLRERVVQMMQRSVIHLT